MSNDSIQLTLELRDVMGKQVRGLRRQGQIPAVIFERGKPSVHVMARLSEIERVYKHAGKNHPVEITVGSEKHLAMIANVDIDPRAYAIRHVAFHAVNRNETVQAEVAVHIEGSIPAEQKSLMVLNPTTEVMVEALPNNLPDSLNISGESLSEEGDKLTAGDLKLPEGVTLITEPERVIAIVEVPRAAIEEEPEPEEGDEAEAAEGGEEGGGEGEKPADTESDKKE